MRRRLFEPEVPIPEEIREAVELWTAYKAEQFKFRYKPLALAALVERMAAMGPERAMAAVKWSIAQGYEGLFEEKKQTGRANSAGLPPPSWALPHMTEGEVEEWPFWDRHERKGFLENLSSNVRGGVRLYH